MSSPCGSCQCFPCSCPRVTLGEGRYTYQPNICNNPKWYYPGTYDPDGPSIYCAICYANPCICLRHACGCPLSNCFCTVSLSNADTCCDDPACDGCLSEDEPIEEHDMQQHRSEGMRCSTCMWWVEQVDQGLSWWSWSLGRCRKHAPRLEGWPAVYDIDWCGDHKLDEAKLK
jgi:hypothetical protein